MGNWKTVAAVMVGSLVVLGLVVLGMSRLSGEGDQVRLAGTEGEARLVQGDSEAKVTVVEFSDFQCPACRAAQPVVKRMLVENPRVRLVYRHLPLYEIHPNAEAGALAAEAAYAQGKFWEYHDWLFINQSRWAEEKDPTAIFVSAAGELGLDKGKFEADLMGKVHKGLVDADYAAGLGLGVNATPTFFVNGIKINTGGLEALVKEEIKTTNGQ